MKTIDTSKPWHVHAATENAHPEIVGPGGICMDVYDATTSQAQEIADILNGAAGVYSVKARAGDCDIVYSAPAADEVMWMYHQGEQKVTASPAPERETFVSINDAGGLVFDEASKLFVHSGRQGGKSYATDVSRAQVISNLNNRVQALSKERDGALQALDGYKKLAEERNTRRMALVRERDCALDELKHYKVLAEERNRHLVNQGKKIGKLESDLSHANSVAEKLQYKCNVWEGTAAQYARDTQWYQEQLDRCGVALGHEAYVSDDGSVQDKPLRAKVAEMVEKLCAAANSQSAVIGDMLDHAVANPTDAQRAEIRHAIEAMQAERRPAEPARGPCAKQRVVATIVTSDGRQFTGENDCLNPQNFCVRDERGLGTGEGYELCKEVCQQTDHAEINAIKAAGKAAKGSVMYIEGHTYACEPCRAAMVRAGVIGYRFSAPPLKPYAGDDKPLPKDLPSRLAELAHAAEGKIWESVTRSMREAAEELKMLRERTDSAMGVGDGSGQLFVYGNRNSIKAAQRLIDRPYIPDVPTMRDAFITYESGAGGSRMVFKFDKLDNMQQAGREWNALDRALQERAK